MTVSKEKFPLFMIYLVSVFKWKLMALKPQALIMIAVLRLRVSLIIINSSQLRENKVHHPVQHLSAVEVFLSSDPW